MLCNDIPQKDIAEKYSISISLVSNIKNGKTYKHITGTQTRPTTNKPIEMYKERLYSKTKIVGECIVWTGLLATNGYGKISINGKTISTHRMAYILEYGHIPDGLVVRHLCNIKSCINTNHLQLGTQAENMMDVLNSDHNSFAKLTTKQVKDIKKMLSNGENKEKIANLFDVSYHSIYRIATNRTWKNVI